MTLDKFTGIVFCVLVGFLLGVITGINYAKTESSPVEETKIDSLINQRDVVKIKVNELDSIKNAKIIEVTSLDDDSTVKLFYELVRE